MDDGEIRKARNDTLQIENRLITSSKTIYFPLKKTIFFFIRLLNTNYRIIK